ncbi:MAG: SH3 domain-containing protein [Bdellovibrionales bacterium]
MYLKTAVKGKVRWIQKYFSRLCIVFGRFALFSFVLFGFASSLDAAQIGTVVTDGAIVYKKGDFDAPVLGYLRANRKVKISSKTYGPFYRVKLKQGIIGYVSDIDVQPLSGTKRSKKGRARNRNANKQKQASSKKYRNKPVMGSQYVGAGFGSISFSDRFKSSSDGSQITKSSSTMFVGFKYTGPSKYLDGPLIVDANVLLAASLPTFYDDISSTPAVGNVMLVDVGLLNPMFNNRSDNYSLYYGAAIQLFYTDFEITVSSVSVPATEWALGASLKLGGAYSFGKFVLKFEPTFYFAETNYLGVNFGVQYQL